MALKISVTGKVERIIFSKGEDFFHIFKMKVMDGGSPSFHAVSGSVHKLKLGDDVKVVGEKVIHKRFGEQIKASSIDNLTQGEILKSNANLTAEGVKQYLQNDIKGVGNKIAQTIADNLGGEALDIIADGWECLTRIGITESRARSIHQQVSENIKIARVLAEMGGMGITPKMAARIIKSYGAKGMNADSMTAMIRKNPYSLCNVDGIGFDKADGYAMALGIERDSEYRIISGIAYVLSSKVMTSGSCGMTTSDLVSASKKSLGADIEDAKYLSGIKKLSDTGKIIIEQDRCYDRIAYLAEESIANDIMRLRGAENRHSPEKISLLIETVQNELGITLSKSQRAAAAMALNNKVSIITGQPGTGKTTILKVIIGVIAKIDNSGITMFAPSGMASKRMTKACQHPASTMHRALQAQGENGGFARNRKNPILTGNFIADEVSMADVHLMAAALQAVPDEARFIFVGDVEQLESVGPGSVLGDLIESETIPVSRLTEIRRQGKGSNIIEAIDRIKNGRLPIPASADERADLFDEPCELPRKSDYILNVVPKDQVCECIVSAIMDRVNDGIPPKDIQALAPQRTTDIGVTALNAALQPILNERLRDGSAGDGLSRFDTTYYAGDRIMQLNNETYDLCGDEVDICNGEIGYVVSVDPESRTMSIDFDGLVIDYNHDMLDDIALAYACTIHKYQGSEAPYVVMPVATQNIFMLNRNLIYTGYSRAREELVVVTDGEEMMDDEDGSQGLVMSKALRVAVKKSSKGQRMTTLLAKLKNMQYEEDMSQQESMLLRL